MSTETLEAEINQQVAIIERSAVVFKNAPEILLANQARSSKALQVGKSILFAIEEEGMSPELDERAKKYMINAGTALKEMKEVRSEVTQIMDALKKMYTEVENNLDCKKAGTIPAKIQSFRDEYAKQVFAQQERKRKEAERIAAKANEAIEIKFKLETTVMNKYSAHLLEKKQSFLYSFNNLNLENFEEKSAILKGLKPNCKFDGGSYNLALALYHSAQEIREMHQAVVAEKLPEIIANYNAEITLAIDELIDKLPSKLAELQEQKRIADVQAAEEERQRLAEIERQKQIAAANKKEKERLEKEAEIARAAEQKRLAELKIEQEKATAEKKRREEEEAAKMKQEAEDARLKSEQEAEIKKQGEQTMVMFEKEASVAENGAAPDARQGYEISVLHAAGYVQIFQLWFENEGKNLPLDKIGNTKLDQMKGWAEKHAHKTGTKIDSKFVKYEESFKAINKKSK
jgi:hypothetical protein